MMKAKLPLAVLLARRVERGEDDECWPCRGSNTGRGYTTVKVGGRGGQAWYAHRAAWALAHGAIPDGLYVCHHCDNPRCCNPAHLFLGTHADNMADCWRKGRHARGLRVGGAKLTDEQVKDLRASYALCRVTQQALADRFGISLAHANAIITGRRRTCRPEEMGYEADGEREAA